jgi:hypothetical protein
MEKGGLAAGSVPSYSWGKDKLTVGPHVGRPGIRQWPGWAAPVARGGGAISLNRVPPVWFSCGPGVGLNDWVSPVAMGQPTSPLRNKFSIFQTEPVL